VNFQIIANEIALLVIGIGIAFLANMHMPNVEKELERYRKEIEENFRIILKEFSSFLREGDRHWDGKEIAETPRLLKEAKALALRDIENHINGANYSYYRYFEIREKQFEILERIAPIVSSMRTCCAQGEMIARFLDKLADAIHPGNTASRYLEELEQLRQEFKESPLPQTREEFETQATLLHFINEMRRYLIIKRDLYKEALKPCRKKEKNVPSILVITFRKWKKAWGR
jgi:uncharacterized membrane protein YgaE (UPF0421/DUF939 family)